MNLPTFDPKLKQASAEIEAILNKYGIAGAICLASSTHGEWLLHFPTWSLVEMAPTGIRVRTKAADPELTNASMHLLLGLRDQAGLQYQQLEAVCQAVSRHLDIEHRPFNQFHALDGWQKPSLRPAPARIRDNKGGKGFGKR